MDTVEDKTPKTKQMVAPGDAPQISISQFAQAYKAFKNTVSVLSEKFRRTETSVIKYLLENICEYRVKYLLEHGNNGNNRKFDRYFSVKHEFIKTKFVHKLTIALRNHAIKACIATEEKNRIGVFDVIIRTNGHVIFIEDSKQSKRIIIELKSGESVDLHQVERYIWECDTLFLIRLPFNQVIRITHDELQNYLTASLIDLMQRAAMITDTNSQKIAGPYCRGCPVSSCEFCKPDQNRQTVAYKTETITKDLLGLFYNVHECLDLAVEMIIRELQPNASQGANYDAK